MKTSELYDLCAEKGIDVFSTSLPLTESVSVLTPSGHCYIGMDPAQLACSKDERVHLAHEVGHCETGSFYNPYTPFDVRQKHEAKADKWAVSALIPRTAWFQALANGIRTVCELADYFDVTEDFVRKAGYIYAGAVCMR